MAVRRSTLAWLLAGAIPVINAAQEPLLSESCPNYATYSTYIHYPLTNGDLHLPFQRPEERCRTFRSESIERVVKDMADRILDPDLARLFENAFPSTTDTTIKFHTKGKDTGFSNFAGWVNADSDGAWQGTHTFVVTGDINAEWLRDSTNQLRPYQPLAKTDPAVFDLILGAVNTQAEYVIKSPYCNAFQPPPISNLPVANNGQEDNVHPIYEPDVVFECKYELDSLAHFLALGNDLYKFTGSTDFVHKRWLKALDTVLRVLDEQSKPTFDEKGKFHRNEYTFQRKTDMGTETLNLGGTGNPLNSDTGLVRSAFRPSDDATILGFFIPANAMMSVELKRTAEFLRKVNQNGRASRVEKWAKQLEEGVWEHGVVQHKKYGEVFAYEVDGYGSSILMDDANYPSLLALPVMGFCSKDHPTYRNTRKMLLEKKGNPYYLVGSDFIGIGGPHIGLQNAWPMSLLIQAQTSDDDDEIVDCLQTVLGSCRLGLVHESIDVNQLNSFTRSWFAWANGVLAVTLLDLAKRKPHLVFGDDAEPYEI